MVTVFTSDIEIRDLLREYFKGLALDWSDEDTCLVDDYISLTRLTKFLYSKGNADLGIKDVGKG